MTRENRGLPSKQSHSKICGYCGQDIVVPNEITRLNIEPKVRMIAMRLWRYRNRLVPYGSFEGVSNRALQVYVCKLRMAFKDIGMPWHIMCVAHEGYILVVPMDEGTDEANSAAKRQEALHS